ncbi:MAG: hypothetical protein U9O24_00145 [Campylobacterota bacterium]|nr:hypothetical protein [Campylobacterota bacterium]
MKKLFYIFFLLVGVGLFAETESKKNDAKSVSTNEVKKVIVATRGDIKVIEASENIRYLSQKIVKDYIFFYQHQNKLLVKKKLNQALLSLTEDLRVIATTTKDSDTKDILEFLAYSKDQIEEIFQDKSDKEKVALMLDYSETLLEGADSIAYAHKYDFSKEEEMLMITKEMEYLLERITKYYMALHVGFDSKTNKEQMKDSILRFEANIEHINRYEYPHEYDDVQSLINKSWKINKIFFDKSENLFIPKLMFTSIEYMEDLVTKIALYHAKNQ